MNRTADRFAAWSAKCNQSIGLIEAMRSRYPMTSWQMEVVRNCDRMHNQVSWFHAEKLPA